MVGKKAQSPSLSIVCLFRFWLAIHAGAKWQTQREKDTQKCKDGHTARIGEKMLAQNIQIQLIHLSSQTRFIQE